MRWLGRWFWAPIKSGENAAQTIVRVLGNLFRISLTVLVLGVGTVFAFALYSSQQSSANYKAEQTDKDLIRVRAQIVEDEDLGDICSEAYPLIVAVTNNSTKALMSMTVELAAREEGSSTNKLGYTDGRVEWDVIVPPQHQYYQCWSVKPQHRRLIYSGEAQSFSMKLEPVADWMLKETKAFKIEPK